MVSKLKIPTEKELLDGLNEYTGHADEAATLLSGEIPPFKGSQDGQLNWDEWFDNDCRVSDDFMETRDQPDSGGDSQ